MNPVTGYQHMLFGAVGGEIVVEIEVPERLVGSIPVAWPDSLNGIPVDFAKKVIDAIEWKTDANPDEWWIERQTLYRR